jgi:hypothetical protein
LNRHIGAAFLDLRPQWEFFRAGFSCGCSARCAGVCRCPDRRRKSPAVPLRPARLCGADAVRVVLGVVREGGR